MKLDLSTYAPGLKLTPPQFDAAQRAFIQVFANAQHEMPDDMHGIRKERFIYLLRMRPKFAQYMHDFDAALREITGQEPFKYPDAPQEPEEVEVAPPEPEPEAPSEAAPEAEPETPPVAAPTCMDRAIDRFVTSEKERHERRRAYDAKRKLKAEGGEQDDAPVEEKPAKPVVDEAPDHDGPPWAKIMQINHRRILGNIPDHTLDPAIDRLKTFVFNFLSEKVSEYTIPELDAKSERPAWDKITRYAEPVRRLADALLLTESRIDALLRHSGAMSVRQLWDYLRVPKVCEAMRNEIQAALKTMPDRPKDAFDLHRALKSWRRKRGSNIKVRAARWGFLNASRLEQAFINFHGRSLTEIEVDLCGECLGEIVPLAPTFYAPVAHHVQDLDESPAQGSGVGVQGSESTGEALIEEEKLRNRQVS